MNLAATLAEIRALPIDRRIELVEAIWDSIAAENGPADITESQKKDLDRRLAELDANPQNVLSWEQIKEHVRGRHDLAAGISSGRPGGCAGSVSLV